MSLHERVSTVLNCLAFNNLTIPILIQEVLGGYSGDEAYKKAAGELRISAGDICTKLMSHTTDDVVLSWAFEMVVERLRAEVLGLASESGGLHFNASKARFNHFEGPFIEQIALTMQKAAPFLWTVVAELLDPNHGSRRVKPDGREDPERVGCEDGPPLKRQRTDRAVKRNAAVLQIKKVVSISIFLQSTNERCNYLQSLLGIFYHSTAVPEKVIEVLAHSGLSIAISSISNAVTSLSRGAEEKIRNTAQTLTAAFAYDNFDIMFHVAEPTLGSSSSLISSTSATLIPLYGVETLESLRCSRALWAADSRNPVLLMRPLRPNSNDLLQLCLAHAPTQRPSPGKLSPLHACFAWHVRDILVRRAGCFAHFLSVLGQPEPVNPIPLHKTTQVPCRAMNIKESTPDGNIEVVNCLLRQGGIGEPDGDEFAMGKEVDMSEYVILFHGDLLTKERLDSVRESRRIEATPKERFQFVIFVPGLFHFKMACADALWRTWVKPNESRTDKNSMFQHVGVLRPNETGKFGSKPTFRQLHDLTHHDIWASMLVCWELEAKAHGFGSLEKFAESKPSWDLITEFSEAIIKKYVATTPKMSREREKPQRERDEVFENQTLRNRDQLLYLETSHAMNAGDIGRVEATFLPWIYTFKATGKHKYAAHMTQFIKNMRDVYSKDLQRIIRMNWLCNPTGKAHSFRAVDWVLERNNLYTKVIHGGSGTSRNMKHIIKESPLIELYRECHVAIEKGFYLEHRTIRHQHPDVTNSLRKLCARMQENMSLVFTLGRRADLCIPDQISVAMDLSGKEKITDAIDEDDKDEVEADDLMADD